MATGEHWLDQALNAVSNGSYGGGPSSSLLRILSSSGEEPRLQFGALFAASMVQDSNLNASVYLSSMSREEVGASVTDPEEPEEPEERPEYVRPNGQTYYARKWGKYWDVDVLKQAREEQQFVLMLGAPGTGKTAMAEAAFGEELITTVMTGDTMVSGLVGGYVPDGQGGYRWSPGPLQIAVQEGRPLLVDEILLANPVVLSVLYPLMDGRGFLDIQENPDLGVIHAKDGFFLVGAANPDVPGAKLSDALGSRFPIHVEVTTDWELARTLGVDDRIVTFFESLSLTAKAKNPETTWAPQFRELLAFKALEEKFGREFAIRNLMRLVPKQDVEVVQAKLAPLLGSIDLVRPATI